MSGSEDPEGPVDFQQLYEQAPCGWFVMQLDGTVLHANAMMRAMCGRPTLEQTRFPDLLTMGGRIYYQTHCVPMLRIAGGVHEIALELCRPSGAPLPVLLNALLASDGLVHGTVFDASDRRSYENQLLLARQEAETTATALRNAEASLRHAATHDALTGLPNRARMTDLLEHHLAGGKRVCVFFIDLDRFKAVNDSLGHAAGDVLLRTVADRLQHAGGPDSVLARWGGDEFLLLVPQNDEDVAVHDRAQALLSSVSLPVDVGRMVVEVGASIGIAWSEDTGLDADALVRRADEAMYRAKERGRNGYQLANQSSPAPLEVAVQLVGDLRAGVAGGQLRLHYQPRIKLATGAVTGVEALVRWQHPTRGLIPPSQFIDAAERSGLIRDIDRWVLDEAVKQAARWNASRTIDMAVNLSAPEMADPDLPSRVAAACHSYGLAPNRLTLEVTETALLVDTELALANAHALRSSGVRLALDDFGTGYSGFTYLRRLPVDEIKIDRAFVAGMNDHASDRAIVRGTIAMGHELDLEVVAEGVELPAQDEALAALGCDTAQGYLYLRPTSPEDVEPFLPSRAAARSRRRHAVARRKGEPAAPPNAREAHIAGA